MPAIYTPYSCNRYTSKWPECSICLCTSENMQNWASFTPVGKPFTICPIPFSLMPNGVLVQCTCTYIFREISQSPSPCIVLLFNRFLPYFYIFLLHPFFRSFFYFFNKHFPYNTYNKYSQENVDYICLGRMCFATLLNTFTRNRMECGLEKEGEQEKCMNMLLMMFVNDGGGHRLLP